MKLFFVLIFVFYNKASACTAFLKSTPQRFVVAKNFDWDLGHGLLTVNKRNVQKIALVPPQGTNQGLAQAPESIAAPLLWTSKYGSITFNQLGRELPYGGMNEKGLVIEILWLAETEYPAQIPEVMEANESQWIQSMLDRAQDVDEVTELAKGFQIRSRHGKVHYFVCDTTGSCATFEYLKGQIIVTRLNKKTDIKVLTNNSYEEGKKALKNYLPFGGAKKTPDDDSSLSRFVRAASLLKGSSGGTPLVESTFKILEGVRNPETTQWSIVYDPTLQKIYFRTKSQREIKEVSLNYFNWSCGAAVKVLDINAPYKQDVSSHFEDYSDRLNSSIVEKNSFLPRESWKAIESAPTHDRCI